MKKVYINPTVETYLIQTRNNLLTTSDISVSSTDLNLTDPGTQILGREFDIEETNEFEEFEEYDY
jgi:hypothetical protein